MTTHCTVYGIPNCDTVKKARAWLTAQGIEHRFHDFKKLGVPDDRLGHWLDALGWQALVNTRGTTWRKLSESERGLVVDPVSARTLMLACPSVIKRPVVEWTSGKVSTGFNAQEWVA